MHKLRLKTLILLTAYLLLNSSATAAADDRPNIVLIMCDDMGFSDIGCYGGEVKTPNLNRLAKAGLRFTQFYNNAKCTTTRASLLTGIYPRPRGGLLKMNMVTIGEVMHSAGYQTVLTGKWHLGRSTNGNRITHPHLRGFSEYYGLLDGCCNFFDPSIQDPPYKGSRNRVFAHNTKRITEFPKDYYTTDAFTNHAIKTISDMAKRAKPFFLHITYTAPHYPLHAKPEHIARYKGKFKMGWDAMRKARFQRQREMGLIDETWKLSAADSQSYDWSTADQDFEDLRMAVYAAMIDSMDQNIGRLLLTLEKLDIAENTLFLFLSDNGGCAEEPGGRDPHKRTPGPKDDYVAVGPAWGWAQNAPFKRYKSWVHEGGICTPFIAHWPGQIEPNSITTQPGHIIDLLPTCLEIAGGQYPSEYNGQKIIPVEGKSLLPILHGKTRAAHKQLCWEWSGNAAIRQGDWKLVWDKRIKAWELYNLAKDRTETNDLAKQNPERVTQLAAAYHEWAKRTGNRTIPSKN